MAKFDYFTEKNMEKRVCAGKSRIRSRYSKNIRGFEGERQGKTKIKLDSDEMSGEMNVDIQNMSVKINTRNKNL